MRSSHLLVILALVALSVVVFFVSTDSGAIRAIDTLEPGEQAHSAGRESPKPLPPSSEGDVAPNGALHAAGERREARAGGAPARESEEGRALHGVLVLPRGAQWDATARILSVAAPERARATAFLFDRIAGNGEAPSRETEVLDSVPVGADGTFRLSFAPNTEWAYLQIDASYLYLAEPQAVRLDGALTQVDLAPLHGARLRGRWLAPPDAAPTELALGGGSAYLTVASDNGMAAIFGVKSNAPAVFHGVRTSSDGSFEMRGVDPSRAWVLVSHPPLQASALTQGLAFVPGETFEVEIALARGAGIAGRVVDGLGAPIEGALVEVALAGEGAGASSEGSDGNEGNEGEFGPTRLFTRSELTRSDGGFSILGLVPGVLVLRAEMDGYRKGIRKKLELGPGALETEVEIKLRRGEALRGTVVWSDGTPAANAVVQVGRDATDRTEPLDLGARKLYGEYAADERGRFEITGLKRRAQTLWAFATRAERGSFVEGAVQKDGVEPSEDGSHALVLAPRPLLTGVVRDGAGAPVSAFRLLVRPDEGAGSMMTSLIAVKNTVEQYVVSADGTFALERLWEGAFAVTIEAEGFATSQPKGFTLPVEVGTPPLEIVLAPFAGVSGLCVSPSGEPVVGAVISASRPAQSGVDVMLAETVAPTSVVANALGQFAFTQLEPGQLVLSASSADWVDSEDLPLELQPGETQVGILLALRLGARLTGEVQDAQGKPIAERSVSVSSQRNDDRRARFMSFDSGEEDTTTDANGWFEFEGLVPGEAVVSLEATEEEIAAARDGREDLWSVMQGTLRETVELVDRATTHVVLGGGPRHGGEPVLVSGRVTLRGGPFSGSVTFSVDAEGPGLPGRGVVLGSAGEYELEVAHPGEYQIHVRSGGADLEGLTSQGYAGEDEGGATTTSIAHDFYRRIPAAKRFELDLALPGGRIAGRVFDADGKPAEKVQMTLRSVGPTPSRGLDFGRFFGENATDRGGTYQFTDLEPGTYVVGAGSPMIALFLGGAMGYGRASATVELGQDEDRRGVDIALGAPCEIEGRVQDALGEPVNGASIFLYDAAGIPVDAFSTTTSNASGRFRAEGLAEGTYTLLARTADLVSALSEPVAARAGHAGSVALRMERGATLVVTLFDSEGRAARASVSATDGQGREFNGILGLSGMFQRMSNGAELRTSRIGPLAPGSYRVLARTDSGQEDSRTVVVRAGDSEIEVDLVLDE